MGIADRLARRAGTPAVLALLLLTIVPIGIGSVAAASGTFASNCPVNVRAKATTTAALRVRIATNTRVTVSGTVSGGAYGTTCGKSVWGTTWLAITAIGGRSVRTDYGVSTVYAAAKLFRAISTSTSTSSARGPYLLGIDVSQWNGPIDFRKVRASGKTFVIARATAGRKITDSMYARNRARALASGIAFTAYHFAMPDTTHNDALSEADHFIAVAQLKKGMLVPVLDLEQGGRLGRTRLTAWVKTWVTRVSSKLGVKPMIYVTKSFWQSYLGNSTWFAEHGYRLWIARWSASAPGVPADHWGGSSWTVWQYSDCGRVPGVRSTCVDLDRFRGKDIDAIRW
ncbi:MAG TPA: glycoside hydrolase family 25 protein [Candidatus Limnocylindrales bacterium]